MDLQYRDLGGGRPTDNAGNPIPGIDADKFSARFTRVINVSTACTVTMEAGGDDGYRVLIDDVEVSSLSDWSVHGIRYDTALVSLTAGTHKLVFEFYENTGEAVYDLDWKS